MFRSEKLYLHEKIMLLTLRDKEGTVTFGVNYSFAIGGAILAELLLGKHIEIEEIKKKKYVRLINRTPIGDPLIDECIDKISKAKRRATIQTWVSKFTGIKNLKHRVAKQLCQRGILKESEDKVLMIFKRKIYPEINPEPEKKLIQQLRNAIFSDDGDVDPKTVVLVSLAHNTGLLNTTFDKKELKKRKKHIEKVINGELAGKAAKEAIEAMQAAIMVAAIVPVIVTTTVST